MSNLAQVVNHMHVVPFPVPRMPGLDAALLSRHVPVARTRVRAGEYIHRAGQPLHALYLVYAGVAKTVLASADGRERVTGFAMRGDLLGGDSLGRATHAGDAVALEDGEVWEVPVSALMSACARVPEIAQGLAATLANDIRVEREWMLATATLGAEQRVAQWLLDLGERQQSRGYSATHFVLRATRAEIGSFLGLKLETVTRAMTSLSERGLIAVERRDVRLVDVAGLRELVTASARVH
jgi:CRP/FNR family transcriptional regulator, anaerobic regulatory protein